MKVHTTVVIMAILAGSQLATAGEVLKLKVLSGRPVVDGVLIDGNGPYRFLIDTGAQTNQLDAAIARAIGLTPTFQVELATAAGVTRVAGGRLNQVTLGSATAAQQEFLFTDLEGVHAVSPEIQGVLGQEFLSHFDYKLDLRAKLLEFNAAVPAGERIPIEQIEGRPIVRTSLGRLVLDSGSDALLLFHSGRAAPSSASIRTASGFAAATSISTVRIRIGGHDYKPAETALVAQPEAPEDGLMPVSMFKAIYVSNSERYVILW